MTRNPTNETNFSIGSFEINLITQRSITDFTKGKQLPPLKIVENQSVIATEKDEQWKTSNKVEPNHTQPSRLMVKN